jgi:hypothetical protein
MSIWTAPAVSGQGFAPWAMMEPPSKRCPATAADTLVSLTRQITCYTEPTGSHANDSENHQRPRGAAWTAREQPRAGGSLVHDQARGGSQGDSSLGLGKVGARLARLNALFEAYEVPLLHSYGGFTRAANTEGGEIEDAREIVFRGYPPRAVGAAPPGRGVGTPAVHPKRESRGAPATLRPASARGPPPIRPTSEMV